MIAIYLLKCSIIWALSLLVYIFLFRNKTKFHLNRSYLIFTLIAGLILPVSHYIDWLTVPSSSPLNQVIAQKELLVELPQFVTTEIQSPVSSPITSYPKNSILWIIYLIGVIVTSIRFISGVWKIRKIHCSGHSKSLDDIQLLIHNQNKLPFSFLNTVYLNQRLLTHSSINSILNHEKAHIRGRHSYDIIVLEFLKILFWFNPLIYLYKKLIREIHEFIADAKACQLEGKKQYCLKLIQPESPINVIDIGNQFYTNSLKKRIRMLQKKSNDNYLRYFFVLPAFCFTLILLSCHTKEDNDPGLEYEVAEILEKIIDKHYYETDSIMANYPDLIENSPKHKSYINNYIQQHYKKLGREIVFMNNEKDFPSTLQKEILEELELEGNLMVEKPYGLRDSQYIDVPKIQFYLPTLRPIRERDLIKSVIPNDRFHPIKKKIVPHSGIDYIACANSPVFAAGAGQVSAVHYYQNGFGKCIRIDHDNGIETFYAHLSKVMVQKGDLVLKGRQIGKVGASGEAVLPHLHFELLKDEKEWNIEVLTEYID